MRIAAADVEAVVNRETGGHSPTWGFSGCACGWVVGDRTEGLRMAQWVAHLIGVLTEDQSPVHPIQVLTELRDQLPTGHQELPGIIRAIEVLRFETERTGT